MSRNEGKAAQGGRIPAPREAEQLVTVSEFAAMARLSRRQIDRLRRRRPAGFQREFELGSGASKFRRCPRFKLSEVNRWLDSRALW